MVTFQRTQVATDCKDREGCILFVDGAVIAIIVRLDAPEHGAIQGKWFLEAGLGRCARVAPLFDTIDDALAWVEKRVSA